MFIYNMLNFSQEKERGLCGSLYINSEIEISINNTVFYKNLIDSNPKIRNPASNPCFGSFNPKNM